ncbi:DAD family-domain-containing protein [Lentinula aciculospora]|uniref:Dolichyl-diphosphooligosaccharide--protein glycosyltransferase subunit OST2 n=1 Tax=Lentinula aciculospora TaxID=153920 RepID=A0A9W9A1C5_9AGAR|nr:DAD family-domain-containing protein [Lentinula aciculospora]
MPPKLSTQSSGNKPSLSVHTSPNTLNPTTSFSTKPSSSSATLSLSSSLQTLLKTYTTQTPPQLKFIDSFLLFLVLSGVIQFSYGVLITGFPFNAFLAGFSSTIGQFVLTASLRQQVNPENRLEFKEVGRERAFADFVFGSIVLHFFVYNFLG